MARQRRTGIKGAKQAAKRSGTGKKAATARQTQNEPQGELLGMDQAIARVKTSRATFYRWLREGRIKGMKLGRQWRFYKEDIERFLKGQAPQIDLPADIAPLIRTLSKRVKEFRARDISQPNATKVERAVTLMIQLGVLMRASDIHITPHIMEGKLQSVAVLRYRVDGALHRVAEIDIRLLPAVVQQWKTMAACNVHECVKPQDGRIMLDLAEKQIDLRVSFFPAALGESLTARILDRDIGGLLKLDRIDFAPRDREKLLHAIESPWGLVVITGPTGCGKTTVLYACLNHVACAERKVMSVEDPVEVFLPWVVQTQLSPTQGVTFSSAVRSMLRSDPDVIMIGEVRDRETLALSLQSALTGHIVLTTLHADESARALKRMVEIGEAPFVVAEATKLIIAQRLVRKLCADCAVTQHPPEDLPARAEALARAGGLDWDSLPKTFRAAVGCPKCGKTGFRGRNVIAEALEVTPEIGAALRRGASVEELRTIAVGQGMTTMAADGVRRAAAGETTLQEVQRVLAVHHEGKSA